MDFSALLDKNYETALIDERYGFIEEVMRETVFGREEKAAATERADRIMTHRIWGLPIFLLIMAGVFFLTFTVGDFFKGYMENRSGSVFHCRAEFSDRPGRKPTS